MDNLQSLLLSALTSGSSREVMMQQLLQQADLDEPTMGLLTRYLSERDAAEDYEGNDEENRYEEQEEKIRRLTELLEETSEKLQRVYTEVEELRDLKTNLTAQLTDLEDRHDRLTAALGICYECLGDDENCPVCGGQGYPGSGYFQSDEELFQYYVVPTLQARAKSQRTNQSKNFRPS